MTEQPDTTAEEACDDDLVANIKALEDPLPTETCAACGQPGAEAACYGCEYVFHMDGGCSMALDVSAALRARIGDKKVAWCNGCEDQRETVAPNWCSAGHVVLSHEWAVHSDCEGGDDWPENYESESE